MVPDQVIVLQLCFIHIYICSIDFIIRVAWPVINVQVSYYFQLAQQHQQQLQQNSGSPTQAQQVHFFLPPKYLKFCQCSKATSVSQNLKRIPLHSHRVNPSLSSRPKLCSQEHQVSKFYRNLWPIGISREFIMNPRRSADNNSEPAATPSYSAPTSTAAATTPAGKNDIQCLK